MIEHYEFIDKKPDGTKERQLGATTQLYNKLSAEETNNIRLKINEIIDRVNISDVPLFSQFGLKFKGAGNTNLSVIEVGDIAHRYNTASGIWDNAIFNGGNSQDEADYTLIVTTYEPELFISTGSSNIFTLAQSGMKAQHLFIDRGMRYKELEWDQSGQDIEVLGAILAAGKKIYIVP
jgi:hypothetical protein